MTAGALSGEALLKTVIAERDSLRTEVERLRAENQQVWNKCDDLDADNRQLRAALEKYADPNYNGYNGGPEHARAALEGNA